MQRPRQILFPKDSRKRSPSPAQGSNQAVPPQTLTLPAGTVIRVRTDEWISTDRNVIGDSFSATLDQPIVVGGWVVARRGQAQTGRVSLVNKGGHGGGASELGVDLPELTLVDGQQLPLQTQLFQTSAGTSHGQDAAIIGTTTGVGAVIGAIAGRGVGAAIGAGIGATAGIIGVISTPGKPTEIPPETVLSFRLQAPVTISTANSQLAFQPVTQSDYDSHSAEGRPHMARRFPPPPYLSLPISLRVCLSVPILVSSALLWLRVLRRLRQVWRLPAVEMNPGTPISRLAFRRVQIAKMPLPGSITRTARLFPCRLLP